MSLRSDYYLQDNHNPFEPPTGDRRDLDKTPLVGPAQRIMNELKGYLMGKQVILAVIYGEWGFGKTILLRKLMRECVKELNNKIFAARFRVPRSITVDFNVALSMALEFFKKCVDLSKEKGAKVYELEDVPQFNEQLDPSNFEPITVSDFFTEVENNIIKPLRERH